MGNKDLLDLLTALAAVGGLLLGIYNILHERRKTKTYLKVIPKWQGIEMFKEITIGGKLTGNRYRTGEEFEVPAVEVVNLSTFAVTLANIGYVVETIGDFSVPLPNEQEFPYRLDSQASITAYPSIKQLKGAKQLFYKRISKAFVVTQSGMRIYGAGKSLRELNRKLKVPEGTDPLDIFRVCEAKVD